MLSNVLGIGLLVQVVLLFAFTITSVGTKGIVQKLRSLLPGCGATCSLKTSQKEELLLVNDCLVLPFVKTEVKTVGRPQKVREETAVFVKRPITTNTVEISWNTFSTDQGNKKCESKGPRSKLAARLEKKRVYFLEAGGNLLPAPPLFARIASKVAALENKHQKRLSKRGVSFLYPVIEF